MHFPMLECCKILNITAPLFLMYLIRKKLAVDRIIIPVRV